MNIMPRSEPVKAGYRFEMELDEGAIPSGEAVKLLHCMRTSKFSNSSKDDVTAQFGQFFSHFMMAFVPASGCKCHTLEKFKLNWKPDMPTELERIIAATYCDHIHESDEMKKIGFYPIHVAAGLGDSALLSIILEKGGDMYSTTSHKGFLPFDIAIINRHAEIADVLLQNRFQYPNDDETLKLKAKTITICLYFNDVECASRCIQAGVKITPIHWKKLMFQALNHSHVNAIKWLLEQGIGDVNDRIRNDYTALHCANTAEVAQLLLDNGADPAIVDDAHGTALMVQLSNRALAVAECIAKFDPSLLDQMVSNGPDVRFNHYSALHNCACAGYLEGVKMLCQYGADHRMITFDGNTAVGLACFSDRLPCVEYLLALGCDTNYQDQDGDTALIYATFHGNSNVVSQLLKHGADPNISNRFGVTPLWNAVYRGSIETVKILLSLNVDPNKASRGRNIFEARHFNRIYDVPVTPLFVAIHHQDITLAKALVSVGCYVNRERYSSSNFEMYVGDWAPENRKWLDHLSSTPPSLMWWCMGVVRNNLPLHPKSAIESLAIPDTLKIYIEDTGLP